MSRVYIVDDDNAVRSALKLLFRTAQLDVEAFSSADAFLRTPTSRSAAAYCWTSACRG